MDPQQHFKIGQALQALRYDGLLVIDSGFSFHSMQEFFAAETVEKRVMNESFEAWLIDTCSNVAINEEERTQRLNAW